MMLFHHCSRRCIRPGCRYHTINFFPYCLHISTTIRFHFHQAWQASICWVTASTPPSCTWNAIQIVSPNGPSSSYNRHWLWYRPGSAGESNRIERSISSLGATDWSNRTASSPLRKSPDTYLNTEPRGHAWGPLFRTRSVLTNAVSGVTASPLPIVRSSTRDMARAGCMAHWLTAAANASSLLARFTGPVNESKYACAEPVPLLLEELFLLLICSQPVHESIFTTLLLLLLQLLLYSVFALLEFVLVAAMALPPLGFFPLKFWLNSKYDQTAASRFQLFISRKKALSVCDSPSASCCIRWMRTSRSVVPIRENSWRSPPQSGSICCGCCCSSLPVVVVVSSTSIVNWECRCKQKRWRRLPQGGDYDTTITATNTSQSSQLPPESQPPTVVQLLSTTYSMIPTYTHTHTRAHPQKHKDASRGSLTQWQPNDSGRLNDDETYRYEIKLQLGNKSSNINLGSNPSTDYVDPAKWLISHVVLTGRTRNASAKLNTNMD